MSSDDLVAPGQPAGQSAETADHLAALGDEIVGLVVALGDVGGEPVVFAVGSVAMVPRADAVVVHAVPHSI